MSDDWDIDSYRAEHENEDHWELRKKFMLTHKDKFPEDELVCLAQVFTNIEFMGCRYPDKTMIRVAELAKGVVEKYRDERKNSLKRTFVAASDAASSKVKGHVNKVERTDPPNKIQKTIFTESESLNEKKSDIETITLDDESGNIKTESNSSKQRYGGVKTYNINPNEKSEKIVEKQSGPLKNFVLIIGCEEHPVSMIQRSAIMNKSTISWNFEDGVGALKVCKLFLNSEFIAMGVGENKKSSKENAAVAAVAKIKESCYGIKVKSRFFSDTTIDSTQIGTSNEIDSSKKLGEDNIGRKLMKLMGWQGGGLGSKEQGIEEPVTASLQVRRDGFGQNKNKSNIFDFKKKAKEFIKTWMQSDSNQDLIFSSEFSSDERKVMHEIASSFSLKSKSYGKDSNRQLVISRKSEPWEIVQDLLKSNGVSDKYELLYPTKMSKF